MKTILGSRLSAHLMCAAILFLFAASPSRARAQRQYNSPSRVSPFEVSVGYNAIRANAPVGGCGCFYMQGGRAEVGFPVFRWVGGVAEVGGGYANHINSFGDDVARMTYLLGPESRTKRVTGQQFSRRRSSGEPTDLTATSPRPRPHRQAQTRSHSQLAEGSICVCLSVSPCECCRLTISTPNFPTPEATGKTTLVSAAELSSDSTERRDYQACLPSRS